MGKEIHQVQIERLSNEFNQLDKTGMCYAIKNGRLSNGVNRDYTGAVTQIRVNNNSLEIWNAGLLPEELKVEMLYGQHI